MVYGFALQEGEAYCKPSKNLQCVWSKLKAENVERRTGCHVTSVSAWEILNGVDDKLSYLYKVCNIIIPPISQWQ